MKKLFALATLFVSGFSIFASSLDEVQEEMRVNLVELEVKVKDLKGNFVSGLGPEDFVVKENGKAQKIDSFEEIELFRLPEEEIQDYKSRVMILLDLSNTSYGMMNRIFPQLRDYVDMLYTGNTELGLAINARGIYNLTGFTQDPEALNRAIDHAEALLKRTKSRRYNVNDRSYDTDLEGAGDYLESQRAYLNYFTPYPYRLENEDLFRYSVDGYYRQQLGVLGQFVRYLGAFSGKKNLVLISESWLAPNATDHEGDTNREGIISLKDIQTTCLQEKIAINVISLSRGANLTRPRAMRASSERAFDRAADLAAATSGNYFLGNQKMVAKFLERTLENAEQYYRIRYYSDYAGAKFRRIRVNAKGLNRIALNLGGYYPQSNEVKPESANAQMVAASKSALDLSVETDWMRWEWAGWKKRRANYAVSQRIYDENGKLVSEKVLAGELRKRKWQGNYEHMPLKLRLESEVPGKGRPSLIETEIIDLTSGRKIQLKTRPKGELI